MSSGLGPMLPIAFIVAGQINPQPNGTVTVTYPKGSTTVLSIQPAGSGPALAPFGCNWQTRPAGTAGAYECAIIAPQGLVYCPDGITPIVLPYLPNCPNT